MKKLIYLIPLAIFTVMVFFFMIGLERDPHLIPSPFIGKPAPEFSLAQLIDADKTLSNTDLQGQVTLLNFWATWCPTCRGEHDVLMEIARGNGEIAIYGIDYKDDAITARKWLDQLGNPYRAVGFDQEGKTGIDWGVYGTPETFVLDKQGIIRYKHIGAVTWEDWKNTLEPMIRELQ